MTDHLDPVRTSADIKASYRRYLGSLLSARDPKIAEALTRSHRRDTNAREGPVP